jgi:23S rRNA pseudouridine2605 synthase
MTAPGGPMRVQRALARAGVASRRHAEELIAAGRVTVNGVVAQTGQVVDPAHDAIAVDGKRVDAPSRTAEWIVLNKPSGVLTTRADPDGRPTVFAHVPDQPGLTYVGRLDYLTEGVLLLTTDGAAANALTHPSNEVERTYVAIVRGEAGRAAREAVRGVQLGDGEVKAVEADAVPVGKGRWEFRVVLTEGRNREVRRLCEALGLTVERLVRTRFGPVSLGALEPGQSRPLSVAEGRAIKELARRRRPTRAPE